MSSFFSQAKLTEEKNTLFGWNLTDTILVCDYIFKKLGFQKVFENENDI